ncbi:MAG: patatin-like phospholipase family protein [Candidatus Krumholzibacteriia bacterium]
MTEQSPPDGGPACAAIPAPWFAGAPRAGLVLGGGGARGLASIGIVEVLEAEGLRPVAIAGTSMGALVGAFLAAGHSAADCHAIARSLRWTDVLDLGRHGGLFKGARYGRWLAERLPARFADLKLPLAVTATDIERGESVVLREGDLIGAIRASTAFPGAFIPVEHDGRLLVDGGVLNTLPLDVIRGYDVGLVVAADFAAPRARPLDAGDPGAGWHQLWESLTFRRRGLAADVLLKAVDIMQAEIAAERLRRHPPDVWIAPIMDHIRIEDFRRHEEIIAAGAAEARHVLDRLRRHGLRPHVNGAARPNGPRGSA